MGRFYYSNGKTMFDDGAGSTREIESIASEDAFWNKINSGGYNALLQSMLDNGELPESKQAASGNGLVDVTPGGVTTSGSYSYSRSGSSGSYGSYNGAGAKTYGSDMYSPTAGLSGYDTASRAKELTPDYALNYASDEKLTNYDTSGRAKELTPDYALDYLPDAAGQAYQQAMAKIGADLGERPVYDGKYDSLLDDAYNKIVSRGEFKWDPDTDEFYRGYEQRYTDLGRRAMEDTIGQASALTGGYGNTYAQRAGQDAYNNWMDALMEKSVQLEQRAYDRWKDAGDEMYNQFGLLSNLRDNDYGQYRDSVSDYNYNLALLQAYEADNYARALDANNLRIQAEQTGYNRARDELSDMRYADELGYARARDALDDLRYNDELGYNRARDELSDLRYNDQLGYDRWRDQVADDRYNTEWAYQVQRDQVSDNQWLQELAYKQARDASADSQWQQEFDLKRSQLNNSGSSSSSGSSGRSSGGSSSGSGSSSNNPYGYTSAEVLNIQRQLNGLGAGLAEDGIWGPKTQAAYDKYYNGATVYDSNYGVYNMGELIDAAASGMSRSQIESVLKDRGIDVNSAAVKEDIRIALSK